MGSRTVVQGVMMPEMRLRVPWSDECPSGVHRRLDSMPPAPTVADLVREVQLIAQGCQCVVVLRWCCGMDSRGAVARCDGSVVEMPAGSPGQLLSWASRVTKPAVLPVPVRLKPWLPFGNAAVVPIATPAWSAGVIITPSGPYILSQWAALRAVAAEVALRLERADRHLSSRVSLPPCGTCREVAV